MDKLSISQYALSVSENILKEYRPTIISKIHKDTSHLSTYQHLIHQLHYARFIQEENRRETFLETVIRFMDYIVEHCNGLGYKLTENEFIELFNSVINLDVFPSMRLLWCAGNAVKKNFSASYNCSYLSILDVETFSEILFLGMSGVGVGFSVEQKFVSQLPTVPSEIVQIEKHLCVEDSREGWSETLTQYLKLLYSGFCPHVDVSKIRPAGMRLSNAGGFSSGPECYIKLIEKIKETFYKAKGRKLTSLECHDLVCYIADAAIAGGTRRSALISFSDLDDKEMQTAKSGQWWKDNPQRALANNSAVYIDRPDFDIFNQEWQNLVESGSGERGIFNEHSVLKKSNQIGRRDPSITYRSNPCLAPETLVITRKGIFPIELLVDQEVEIWNGKKWEKISTFTQTGEKQPLLKFTFYNGYELRLTPYHTCYLKDNTEILAKDIVPGMELLRTQVEMNEGNIEDKSSYLKAFLLVHGHIHSLTEKAKLFLKYQYIACFDKICSSLKNVKFDNTYHETVFENLPYNFIQNSSDNYVLFGMAEKQKELIPWCLKKNTIQGLLYALQLDLSSRIDFISGMYDAKGVALDDEGDIYYGIRFDFYEEANVFSALLSSLGIYSVISFHKEKEYESQYATVYVKNYEAIKLSRIASFQRIVSFKNDKYLEESHIDSFTVMDIKEDGVAEKVYCCNVPSNNKFTLANKVVTGNCSEIQLQHRQFCNLSNVNIRPNDSLKDIVRKVKLATIFGTIQSSITDFQFLNKHWKKNTESERLLGVSLSGIADSPVFFPEDVTLSSLKPLRKILNYAKYVAVQENREWSKKLSISMSNAITTIKPSGDSSQLSDTSSGIHPRYSPYYIRRIRMNSLDPIAEQLIERKIPYEIDVTNNNVYVFSFPQMSPKHVKIFGSNLHPVNHFKIWLEYSKYWSEHLVSCTIMVHDAQQWEDLRDHIYTQFDSVCGLSFLPYDDHVYQQAPYEKIDEKTYEELNKKIPHINFSEFKEYSDRTEAPLACVGEMCQIKEYK